MERDFSSSVFKEDFVPQQESETRGNPLFEIEDSHSTAFIGMFLDAQNDGILAGLASSRSDHDHISPRVPTLLTHEDQELISVLSCYAPEELVTMVTRGKAPATPHVPPQATPPWV